MKTLLNIDPKLRVEDPESILPLPVIIRVTDFEDDSVGQFEDDLSAAHRTGQPIVPIMIHTTGGSAYGLNAMLSAIKHSRLPIATVVTGAAMSAGAILFGFGDEGSRFMDPYAYLMLHELASEGEYSKISDQQVDLRHAQQINDAIYIRLARHLGHDDRYFLNMFNKNKNADLYMNANDAKRHRFANKLYIPWFTVDVSVNVKFE